MPKDKITEYSATNASNTDVGGTGILGTNFASNMDNAIREVMTHLKEMSTGTFPLEDTFTVGDPADLTKRVRLDAGLVTAGQTRVLQAPDVSGTLALHSQIPVLWEAPPTMEYYGGVAGSGNVAANVAAIAAYNTAINGATYPPPLSLADKMWDVGTTAITFPHPNTTLIGSWSARSDGATQGKLLSQKTSGTAFSFTGYAPTLDRVCLAGPGRSSGLAIVADFVGQAAADLDVTLIECLLQGGATAGNARGRGVTMRGGFLNDSTVGFAIGMPGSISAATSYENTREGGSRGYVFDGVRIHANVGQAVTNVDTDAEYLHGIQIINCLSDTLGDLFQGMAKHSLFANNVVYMATSQVFRITGAKNLAIHNNVIGGYLMTVAEFDALYPALVDPVYVVNPFYIDGDTEELSIVGNKIAFVSQAPIALISGAHKTMSYCNNGHHRTMLTNDSRTDPIMAIAAGVTVDGLTVRNNTAFLDTLANNASAAWIKNDGTITGLSIGGNVDNAELGRKQVTGSGTVAYFDEITLTPTFTFTTPGDLAVAGTGITGTAWIKDNGRLGFTITGSITITHTTAADNARIDLGLTGITFRGGGYGSQAVNLAYTGQIDMPAGYTQVGALAITGTDQIGLIMTGDNVDLLSVAKDHMPTAGGTYTFDIAGDVAI